MSQCSETRYMNTQSNSLPLAARRPAWDEGLDSQPSRRSPDVPTALAICFSLCKAVGYGMERQRPLVGVGQMAISSGQTRTKKYVFHFFFPLGSNYRERCEVLRGEGLSLSNT